MKYSLSSQGGAALLILLSIIALSLSSFLLTGTSRIQQQLDRPFINSTVLSQAKKALIAYARLSDPDLSGTTGLNMRYLPCPDLDGDGIEETPCGAGSAEGWLPWMSLGLPPLKDASGTCLRYFISSSYKKGAASAPLIASLPTADFTLNNTAQVISNDVVALLVAPGSPLMGQLRELSPATLTECGSSDLASPKNQAANYMETMAGINNALAPVFITGPEQITSSISFNDTLLGILLSEL